ncbi:MAG: hypothetical protein HC771_02825 [Synechococcales cyanobacterium CRU_2_2]|nr:hypothetical protein [Synechococcales cyanobacterium CRU_2_2]
MSLQAVYPVASPSSPLEEAIATGWNPTCRITYNRDAWVKLLHLPSESACDEAQLLCQESPDTWIAWVPNHGEAVLNRSHFYC